MPNWCENTLEVDTTDAITVRLSQYVNPRGNSLGELSLVFQGDNYA